MFLCHDCYSAGTCSRQKLFYLSSLQHYSFAPAQFHVSFEWIIVCNEHLWPNTRFGIRMKSTSRDPTWIFHVKWNSLFHAVNSIFRNFTTSRHETGTFCAKLPYKRWRITFSRHCFVLHFTSPTQNTLRIGIRRHRNCRVQPLESRAHTTHKHIKTIVMSLRHRRMHFSLQYLFSMVLPYSLRVNMKQ